jgi:hypothetical protein
VSPADLFYLLVYAFVGWGMILAVLPRRLNLEVWQWVTVGVIAVVGTAFALWILFATPQASNNEDVTASPAATEQVASGGTTKANAKSVSVADDSSDKQAPSWVMSVEKSLSPLATPVNFFYIVGDVFLLIIASTLLLAFWGGRFAQSWRMIAAATLSLYIADMCFKYADATAIKYESGSLPDVFYVFSGVLFAIGAALEYDVSSRSRRGARKRA